jgi:hypothetical protein
MLLPCKSLTYNTVYRSESVVVVVAFVVVVVVIKIGIKLRNTEMMITRLTIQDTNYTELSFCKIVYFYVKYTQIYFIQVYMGYSILRKMPELHHG